MYNIVIMEIESKNIISNFGGKEMIFEEIRDVICEQLEVDAEEVTLDTTFEALGADSLDLFQVVIEIEEKYGIQLEEAENIKCVRDAVEYVQLKVNK